MNDEIDVRQYLQVVWNRRRIVIAVTATALAAAVLLSFFILRPVYEASALVTLASPRLSLQGGPFAFTQPLLVPAFPQPLLVPAFPALTAGDFIPLVHNESVAAQVAKRLPSDQVRRPALLVRSVRISVVGGRLVKITARDLSPAGAAALAGAWAEVVAEHAGALVSRQDRQSLVELDDRITAARRALGPAEEAWRVFQARSRVPVLAQRVEETARRIAVYESRLVEIEQGGGAIEGGDPAKLRRLHGALKAGLPSLQAQLAAERLREAQALRRVERAREAYEWLVQKREELGVMVEATTDLVSVAVPPAAPDAPVAPRKAVIIILAAIFGLLAGVVLAFVIEYFAPSVDAAMARPIT